MGLAGLERLLDRDLIRVGHHPDLTGLRILSDHRWDMKFIGMQGPAISRDDGRTLRLQLDGEGRPARRLRPSTTTR